MIKVNLHISITKRFISEWLTLTKYEDRKGSFVKI